MLIAALLRSISRQPRSTTAALLAVLIAVGGSTLPSTSRADWVLKSIGDAARSLTAKAREAKQAREASSGQGGASSSGFSACPQFFPAGSAPVLSAKSPGLQRQLCFDAFAVIHSGQSKTPLVVVERLTREQLQDAADEKRTNKFFADARVPAAERASLEDYAGSGFDRGHMAPAADMPTAQAMAQSFSLANIVPQDPDNNRNAWADIEKDTRRFAKRASGSVFVMTGPVFSGQAQTIGKGRVWVPTHLFKLVYDETSGRAWAHWIENSPNQRVSKPISYEELVRLTGHNLLASKIPPN